MIIFCDHWMLEDFDIEFSVCLRKHQPEPLCCPRTYRSMICQDRDDASGRTSGASRGAYTVNSEATTPIIFSKIDKMYKIAQCHKNSHKLQRTGMS
jgi:hypothetical protein